MAYSNFDSGIFYIKKIYVELNYFDLRYKNRNNFLKNIFLCFIKEHTIYTTSFIVVQIIGLMILTEYRLNLMWVY